MPDRTVDVIIPSGRIVEVDTLAAEARTVTVDGTLRAHRAAASRLSLFGNLIVRGRGVLDYGRPTDRVLVQAGIRWFLDERRYVGGDTTVPLATDVGLWAIDDAEVWIHGRYRDTWSWLLTTAPAGSSEMTVEPAYAQGWMVGDELVVGPSNLMGSGDVTDADRQDERRRILAVLGPGRFRIDAPLRWAHEVLSVPWTDAWGDAWTERLAAKVANLTSNVILEAGDPNHRPHVMFMDRAKHYVEDLAVVNFSPMITRIPMVRYAWHQHGQGDGSRGSYLRRVRLWGGPGEGLHIHGSWGVIVEDLVIYDQARSYVPQGSEFIINTVPFNFERFGRGNAADDCWVDRPLVMRWGVPFRDYLNSGFWLNQSRACSLVGAAATGGIGQSRSSGMH
ncbi:MAG: G8 domain-containing protein, partial [Armatimonadota bacterium]